MIYISGAISGVPNLNKEQFENAERLLISKGYKVINPLKIDNSTCIKYIDYMINDIRELKKCDIIYMLKGYELSRGARIELRIAQKNNLKIIKEA